MLNSHAKNKIYGYVTKTLGMRTYVRGWLKGDCPNCGRSDKYGINIGMNRTNCFVCGYNPTPIKLITYLEGFSEYRETWAFLKTYDGLRYIEPVVERIERTQVKLPDGFNSIAVGDTMIAKVAREYVQNRGFDIDEVALRGWGYCNQGNYFGYLILPFYVKGELIYYNGRKLIGAGPKYQNPTIEDFGVGKSMIMYNLDALAIYKDIYILEGVFNADTLGDNALATGGKKVADYQISMINKSDVEKVTLVLDPDAYDDSIKLGMDLIFHKKVRLVSWDGDKDVNDIGKKEAMRRIRKSKWLSYNDLLKMKIDNETRSKHTYNL